MIACIYAAGRSLRLGAAFADRQKIMLEFGGKSLLEWHLQHLRAVGVQKLVVVTGHQRQGIRWALDRLPPDYGLEILELVNENFTEGSVLSMYTSIPQIQAANDSILLMDGDVLYCHEIMQRLIGSRHRNALLIDRHFATTDDDPVLVPVCNGKPFEFVKRWQGSADLVGESVGFFKIVCEDIPLLTAEIEKYIAGPGRMESYDEIIRALVRAGRFGYEDITGLPWTEIDFPEDIVFAREKVLPAIVRHERQSAPALRAAIAKPAPTDVF
jgi:choline kinase